MASGFNSAKTGYMNSYNAAHLVVMVDGEQVYGFGQDDMISVSYAQDSQGYSQDPQGTSARYINNKTGATITLNLMPTSPVNKFLTNLHNERKEFAIDIRDDNVHYQSNWCFITKSPDYSAGNQIGNRAWQITALDLDEDSVVGETTNY